MIKKLYLTALFFVLFHSVSKPCSDGNWGMYDYECLILSQELTNEPEYFPFLHDDYKPFYESSQKTDSLNNGNILEWSKYLNIEYNDAYYLIFKTSETDISSLIKKGKTDDEKLNFANKQFIKKYKEALDYLLLAKQLEPFMYISDNNGWYNYEDGGDASDIPYTYTVSDLQKRWKQTSEKEIKLRYGYQLVRLAHYNRYYEEAVDFFDTYVETINYKPEMYYYALSQKAGAIRGLGDIIESNRLFLKVFAHSKDLKKTAVMSIKLNEDIDFENLLDAAKTIDEKNNAELLVGFISFSNPLASARKIIDRSPDAIQAKVLVARAISQLEGHLVYYGSFAGYNDRRYPILDKDYQKNLTDLLVLIQKQADSPNVKNKNYWNITSAYLYFISKQFDKAEAYLAKIDTSEKGYAKEKKILASYIDVSRIPVIDENAEDRIYETYFRTEDADISTFLTNVLANRYYMQKEYAKSFMLQNSLFQLMDNPNMTILFDLEKVYNAPNKSKMEKYISNKFETGLEENKSVSNLISYMKGMVYLTHNDLNSAKREFDKSKIYLDTISADVFGYNQIECFTCPLNMQVDYLNEFPFIKDTMNESQLVDILIKLEQKADGKDLLAAKANYLLGNFFYNTSLTGYFRNFLRFGYMGLYRQEFFKPSDKNYILTDLIYLNSIPTYYDNTTQIADKYLKKAYALATGDEFKARIVFALSKSEQELHYQKIVNDSENTYMSKYNEDWVMISNRYYFKELMKYRDTNFFREVQSNCMYFDYYVNHL